MCDYEFSGFDLFCVKIISSIIFSMFRVDNCSINDALVNLSSCLCIGYSVFVKKVG
jgi:hypothetical protein